MGRRSVLEVFRSWGDAGRHQIIAGYAWSFEAEVTDDNDVGLDLSGATLYAQCRRERGGELLWNYELTPVDLTVGQFDLYVSGADTDVDALDGVWCVVADWGAGDVRPLMEGEHEILRPVVVIPPAAP